MQSKRWTDVTGFVWAKLLYKLVETELVWSKAPLWTRLKQSSALNSFEAKLRYELVRSKAPLWTCLKQSSAMNSFEAKLRYELVWSKAPLWTLLKKSSAMNLFKAKLLYELICPLTHSVYQSRMYSTMYPAIFLCSFCLIVLVFLSSVCLVSLFVSYSAPMDSLSLLTKGSFICRKSNLSRSLKITQVIQYSLNRSLHLHQIKQGLASLALY